MDNSLEANPLPSQGLTEETIDSRLVDAYLSLAGQMLEAAFGPERARWMSRLEQEHANLQIVFNWLIRRGESERGLRLAYLLQELWFEEHHTGEARTLLATLLALPGAATRTRTRAQCLDLAGAFALNQNEYAEARALKREAITIYQELGDRPSLGYALLHLGHVELYEDHPLAAQQLYQEALQLFQDLADQAGIDAAIGNLISATLDLGDYAAAEGLLKEGLQRNRELNDEWGVALALGNAAGIAAGLGQPERAICLAGASTAHRERIGVSLPPVFTERFERMIIPARQALAAPVQARLWEEGERMTLEEAVAYVFNDSPASSEQSV